LRRIAAWSRDLFAHEIETRARWYRRKIVRPGKFVFPRADHFEYRTSVV